MTGLGQTLPAGIDSPVMPMDHAHQARWRTCRPFNGGHPIAVVPLLDKPGSPERVLGTMLRPRARHKDRLLYVGEHPRVGAFAFSQKPDRHFRHNALGIEPVDAGRKGRLHLQMPPYRHVPLLFGILDTPMPSAMDRAVSLLVTRRTTALSPMHPARFSSYRFELVNP